MSTQESSTGKSILLVDDDQFLRDMYSVKFKENGYTVEIAEGGSDALQRIREGLTPSVIVFDIVMPGVDGFEFLQTLQTEQLVPKAVKIALSNQGQDTDREKALALGAKGYIVKANTIPSEVVSEVMKLSNAQ